MSTVPNSQHGSRSDRACLQSGAAVIGNSKGTRPMLTGGSRGTSPDGSPFSFSTKVEINPGTGLFVARAVLKEV